MGWLEYADRFMHMVISKPADRIALVAGDGHPLLAQAVADALGIVPMPLAISAFADGESRIRLEGDVADQDVYILQPTSTPTNERLMTLALMADAARGAGAHRVTALLPYFGYARQDVRSQPGEPRSAQFAARLLRTAGVDRAVVLELHSPALESAFDMPLVHLRADEPMLAALRAWGLAQLTVVSPDAGGLKRAQRYAGALGAALAAVAKTRPAPDKAPRRSKYSATCADAPASWLTTWRAPAAPCSARAMHCFVLARRRYMRRSCMR